MYMATFMMQLKRIWNRFFWNVSSLNRYQFSLFMLCNSLYCYFLLSKFQKLISCHFAGLFCFLPPHHVWEGCHYLFTFSRIWMNMVYGLKWCFLPCGNKYYAKLYVYIIIICWTYIEQCILYDDKHKVLSLQKSLEAEGNDPWEWCNLSAFK